MKKNKNGQGLVQLILLTSLVFGVVIGSIYVFGNTLSTTFKNNNPAKIFNAKRTLKHEAPVNIISNININLIGIPVSSPIETIAKTNATKTYSNKTASVARSIETILILKEYVNQLTVVADTINTGTSYTNYKTALNTYKNHLSTAITQLTAAGNDELKIKLILVKLAINLDSSMSTLSNLKNKANAYISSIPSGNEKKKQFLSLFMADVYNLTGSLDYSINNNLYKTILGVNRNNTLAQDNSLISNINTNIGTYTATQKKNYAKKIFIDLNNNYSNIAPDSYNNKVLCNKLCGTLSGNLCTVN